jgi:hypothetical protein
MDIAERARRRSEAGSQEGPLPIVRSKKPEGSTGDCQKPEGRPVQLDTRLLASDCRLLASGFRLLASGFWLPASGFWLPASGFRLLSSGFWLLASGFWLLVFTVPIPSYFVRPSAAWPARAAPGSIPR